MNIGVWHVKMQARVLGMEPCAVHMQWHTLTAPKKAKSLIMATRSSSGQHLQDQKQLCIQFYKMLHSARKAKTLYRETFFSGMHYSIISVAT